MIPFRLLSIDEGFPQRVLRMSLLIAACVLVFSTGFGDFTLSLGLGIGMLISIASLWSFMLMARLLLKPKGQRAAFGGLILFVKYPILILLLYFSLTSWGASGIGMAIGVSLVPAVVVLKLIGMLWVNRMNTADWGNRMKAGPAPGENPKPS